MDCRRFKPGNDGCYGCLAPLHRLRQARLRRARLQRLLLALMRRPARQPDHIEGGADAAVGVGESFAVDLRHPQQRGAAGRRAAAFHQHIGRAHPPQILHQRERVVVAHHDAVDVGDRQRKTCALQQRADIAQVGERRHARRHSALKLGFRRRKRLPQFGQRIAADHRRQQQPIRLQRAADLRQHAGQVVDELQGQRGDCEVDGRRARAAAVRIRYPADRCARARPTRPASAFRT